MPIIDLTMNVTGLIGVYPRIIYINTTDTLTLVLQTGYLNGEQRLGASFRDGDMALVQTKSEPNTFNVDSQFLQVQYSSGNWSLVIPSTGAYVKQACYAGTTTALTVTYNNGVNGVGAYLRNAGANAIFQTDGVSPIINSRILVKNQASTLQNGIYTLTTVGSASIPWVLTRATDYDTPDEIVPGSLVVVLNGTTLAGTVWIEIASVTTIGTDAIVFSQFSVGFPITLAQGGTSASLTASNGGIFYSTATAGAILSGTPTADQILMSGSNVQPDWSTATYPATTTINQLLYSSSTNTIAGLSTANNGILVTSSGGVPSIGNTVGAGLTMPSITFNTTTGVVGTTTNDSAASGSVGEYVSAETSGAPTSLTTLTNVTMASISLTAGDWDVCSTFTFTPAAGTTVSYIAGSISLTNDGYNGTAGSNQIYCYGGTVINTYIGNAMVPVNPVRISIASTTTVYAVGGAGFGVSTCQAYAEIRARRVR